MQLSDVNADPYITFCMKQEMLSKEDEFALIHAYRENGDLSARERLINSHLKLACSMARRMSFFGVGLTDLIQEATIGLMHSIESFDPSLNVRLSQYASFYIKKELHEFVRRNLRMVRVITTNERKKIYAKMYQITNGEGTFSEKIKLVAKELDVRESEVIAVAVHMSRQDDTYDTVPQIEGDDVLSSSISREHHYEHDNPLDQIIHDSEQGVMMNALHKMITNLPAKDKDLLVNRYLTFPPVVYKDIASDTGVSFQAVEKREKNLLKRLGASHRDVMLACA